MKALAALDVIFPQRLKVMYAGEIITVTIKPTNLPKEKSFLASQSSLIRFASSYEVEQINQLRQSTSVTKTMFSLMDEENQALMHEHRLEVRIAYQERKTLAGDISFLVDKIELMQLMMTVGQCHRYLNEITKKLDMSKKQKEKFDIFSSNLSVLEAILINSLNKVDKPYASITPTLEDMPVLTFINSNLSPKVAIRNFLDQLTALFILLDRKNKLELSGISYTSLAQIDELHLKRLILPIIKPIEQINISAAKDGFFAISHSTPHSSPIATDKLITAGIQY